MIDKVLEKQNPDLIKIEDLDISIRGYNALKRMNVNTIGELRIYTEEELLRIRNFGMGALKDVQDSLTKYGLSLDIHRGKQKMLLMEELKKARHELCELKKDISTLSQILTKRIKEFI